MPIGDPMGGETQYDSRGILLGVVAVAIPVRDLASAVSFYEGTLGLTVQRDNRTENWVELGPVGALGRASKEPSSFQVTPPSLSASMRPVEFARSTPFPKLLVWS